MLKLAEHLTNSVYLPLGSHSDWLTPLGRQITLFVRPHNMHRGEICSTVVLFLLSAYVGSATLSEIDSNEAARAAGPAAASLGFNLASLPPARESGSSVWGTRSFHWVAQGPGSDRQMLTYLVSDEALCWTSVEKDVAKDHGCIVVKAGT
jgi:hypothetical protein